MKNIKIFILSVLVSFSFLSVSAQEIYLSVAGKNAPITSGNYTALELWIKPNTTSPNIDVELFDGSLSSQPDIIVGTPNMVTTYDLYRAKDYFENDGKTRKPYPKPSYSISLTNEVEYAKRWVSLGKLKNNETFGYIIVVRVSDHDDVNSFKIKADGWTILSNNISIGLYNIKSNEQIQILPETTIPENTTFSYYGEEDSPISITDSWGITYKKNTPVTSITNEINLPNLIGLTIGGSTYFMNNLAVVSNNTVWWNMNSAIIVSVKNPQIKFEQKPGMLCNSSILTVTDISDNSIKKESVGFYYNGKSFGQGTQAELSNDNAGVFPVKIIFESINQYFPKYIVRDYNVRINQKPSASISGQKSIIAVNQPILLSGQNSNDYEKQPLLYTWLVNGEIRSKQMTYNFQGSIPGIYTIQLVVDDQSPLSKCTTDTATTLVRINAQPYGEIISIDKFSREEIVTFKSNKVTDSDDKFLTYQWVGDGIISDVKKDNIQIKHNKAGKYLISLTISDQTGVSNSDFKITSSYIVNDEPKPNFTIPALVAPRDIVNLNASSSTDSDSKNLEYEWTISDGRTIHEKVSSISFERPGDYDITLSVNDNEGVSNSIQELTKSIHVNAPPVPIIRATDYSSLSKVQFDASNSYDDETDIVSYQWNFGDGSFGSGKMIEHVYQSSGDYTIILTVNDGSAKANSVQSVRHNLTINKYPVAQLTAPTTTEPNVNISVNGEKSYDPDGTIASYTWLLNGNVVSKKSKDDISIPEPGDHILTLKVTDNSNYRDAFGLVSQKIHVNYPPEPIVRLSKSVVEPNEMITFDGSFSKDKDGSITNYVWEFDDGQKMSGKIVKRSFTKNGVHQFSLIVDDGKGFNNSIQTYQGDFLINSSPIIVTQKNIRTNSNRVLLDASKSYDPDAQAIALTWTLPNGEKVKKANFLWESKNGGRQALIVSADDQQGLKNSLTHQEVIIQINRPVVAIVDSIVKACTGQTVLFNSTQCYDPDGDSFVTNWSFGDGTESSETNPAHIYSVPGKYSVELKLHDGFSDYPTIAKIPVIIEGSPIAVSNIIDTTICVNTPIFFDGTKSVDPNGKIGVFSWDFGDGESAFGATITHLFTKPGIYNTVLNVIGVGSGTCSNINQTSSVIRVVEGPSTSIIAKGMISPNEELILASKNQLAGNQIKSAEWNIKLNNETISLMGTDTKYSFEKPGRYVVSLTIITDSKTNCNITTEQKTITVNAAPVLLWDLSENIGKGDFLKLDATRSYDPDGVITTYKWYVDNVLTAIDPLVSFPLMNPGKHTIRLEITDNSKSKTQTVTLEKTIFVNSKPVADFTLDKTIYRGESYTVKPNTLSDADGDSLKTILKVNNRTVMSNTIRFTEPFYKITLIQDDGRNLINSIDSVTKFITVTMPPDILLDLPKQVISNYTYQLPEAVTKQMVTFKDGTTKTTINETGTQSLDLIWKPRNEVLENYSFDLFVLDPIQFTETPEPLTVEWNPSNPEILLVRPKLNRAKNHLLETIWEQDGKMVGYGESVSIKLRKGQNVITVKCRDQEVVGTQFTVVRFSITAR